MPSPFAGKSSSFPPAPSRVTKGPRMDELPDDMVRAFLEGRALWEVLAFEHVSKASKGVVARFFPVLFGRHILSPLDRSERARQRAAMYPPAVRDLVLRGMPRQAEGQDAEGYKLLLAAYYRAVVHSLAQAMADAVVTRAREHAAYAKYNHFGSSAIAVVGPEGEELLTVTFLRKGPVKVALAPDGRRGRRRRGDWRFALNRLSRDGLYEDARAWSSVFIGLLLGVSPLVALRLPDYSGAQRTLSLRTNGELV
jgi:hypothetical protein